MKRIKLSIICTAALLLALPFSGCMQGTSAGKEQKDTELTQQLKERETDGDRPEDDKCPEDDGDCPDCPDCPDGKCPEDGDERPDCPDGKRPRHKLPPWRRGKHRKAVTLPCPDCGDNN